MVIISKYRGVSYHYIPETNRMLHVNYLSALKIHLRGFPGGSGMKDLPDSAGDMDLILDLGRSYMPRSN